MNLLRTPGLDLPVFPEDTPVIHTKKQLVEAATHGAPSFVRSIAVDVPRGLSLQETLTLADEQMKVVNELTDTTTVDHEWGLVRTTPANTRDQRHGRSDKHVVPKNHLLAARVEVIRGTAIDQWEFVDNYTLRVPFRSALRDYEQTYRGKYYLGDIRVSQFVRPFTPDSTGETPRPVLVDIEPRIAKHNLRTRFVGRAACPPSENHLWI